jgi:hypothetical protein
MSFFLLSLSYVLRGTFTTLVCWLLPLLSISFLEYIYTKPWFPAFFLPLMWQGWPFWSLIPVCVCVCVSDVSRYRLKKKCALCVCERPTNCGASTDGLIRRKKRARFVCVCACDFEAERWWWWWATRQVIDVVWILFFFPEFTALYHHGCHWCLFNGKIQKTKIWYMITDTVCFISTPSCCGLILVLSSVILSPFK